MNIEKALDIPRSFASHHGSLAEALACELCEKHGSEFCEFVRMEEQRVILPKS